MLKLKYRYAIALLPFLFPQHALTEPLYLECSIKGQSFDSKFQEIIGIKIDNRMIDISSEEFPMFGEVNESPTSFKATKRFTSHKGVKYFFNIEIDRVSGRFIAYETAAYPNRKVYNTTGSGPCTKITAQKHANLKTGSSHREPIKVIIRNQ